MQQTKNFKMADAISPYLAVSCGLIETKMRQQRQVYITYTLVNGNSMVKIFVWETLPIDCRVMIDSPILFTQNDSAEYTTVVFQHNNKPDTVEPLYNTIVFHQNTHKRHPIARP